MCMDFINIFETIVLSSLIGSVIVLMILIIKRIFKNNLTCTFYYYIWLILLIKLIIPFGPQTSLNISNICEKFYVQSITNENIQKTQVKNSQQLKNTNLGSSTSIGTFQPSNESVISNPVNIPLKTKFNIEKALCLVWLLGVVLLIGILVAGHKRLREIVKTSIKDINITHKEILYNCMNAMNIRTELGISYSPKINSPSLCGLIKPKILIPVSVAFTVRAEEFKYIIMHELSHLKNKDIIINWIITLLSVIYWFNPILLYGFHKMRQECEFSCDAQVISRLGEGENVQYGIAIIKILELVGNSRRLMGTTSMVMNSSEIKRRIIMISKYKKMSIRSILLGTVVVVILCTLGVAMNISKASSNESISKAAAVQASTPLAITKSTANNTSNGTVSPIIKSSSSDSAQPIVPFSSDIVIYNSHPDEDYPSGVKVTDVGALINDKLLKEGLNSSFIKCSPPAEYTKAYQSTRDIITKNVKNYTNTVLLDIHRDASDTSNPDYNTKKIMLTLTKESPYYESNKKFTNLLSKEIGLCSSNQIKPNIIQYKKGVLYFNQDLSKNSILIEIGNDKSTDSDIENCVNALVSALKNVQKVSSN